MLKKTGVLNILDLLITNQDVKKPKPHPEGYIKVLEHFKCSAENAIIVEDSPKGLSAAFSSGCSVLPVKNSYDVDIQLFKGVIK